VFIGIDAPDFNLGLEKRLRNAGIRTVHYVSPTVWAWRAWRIPKIRNAADLVLCLFPFEPDFLAAHQINAAYVGHPLADQIDPVPDPEPSRSALGIERQGPVITLLPGSRQSEAELLAAPILGAAHLLRERFPTAQFIAALANSRVAARFREQLDATPGLQIEMFEGRVREVIAAGDVVICASGTVTLETMLINRPMVVVYRVAASTYHLVRLTRMIKAKRFSLPNILAGKDLVPELTQKHVIPQNIARDAAAWLDDDPRRRALSEEFGRMHATLRCNASHRAATEVARLVEET
jgi:lipid-A-disaccharide synthase